MSHLPFTCNWQNRFWDSEPIIARFPSNKGGNLDIRISHNTTSYTPPHVCVLCAVYVAWAWAVCRNTMFCLLFFSFHQWSLPKKEKGILLYFLCFSWFYYVIICLYSLGSLCFMVILACLVVRFIILSFCYVFLLCFSGLGFLGMYAYACSPWSMHMHRITYVGPMYVNAYISPKP